MTAECTKLRRIRAPRPAVVLVDVLVGVVLLGSVLAVLIGMAARAVSSQETGEKLGIAAMLADEQLQLMLARGPDNYASRYSIEGLCDPPFQSYRYKLQVSGGTGGDPYAVGVTILWFEFGRARSVLVETLMAPRVGAEPDPDRRPRATVERDAG